ncbi:CLCC1 protein, partial [Atractosteus spatula]|nr:CLCC1 protein [Atractosteus spatula]
MRVIVMICGMLVAVNGQVEGDEWIDPTDMLNYDSTSKTMRKVDESKGHDDTADNICIKDDKECKDKTNLVIRPNPSACCLKLSILQQQVEELKNIAVDLKTASGYDPVFERKLGELIESIQKLDFHQEEGHHSTSYEWLLVFAEQCERFLLTWSSTVLTFVWDTSIHNIYPIFMDILKCYEFWAFPAFVTSLLVGICLYKTSL